jgi:DNA-binding CsgD family transcriptional regulator
MLSKKMSKAITKRESQILCHIAQGYSDREIASLLGFKIFTARKHRENLKMKLEVSKSAQFVCHYFRMNPEALKKIHIP